MAIINLCHSNNCTYCKACCSICPHNAISFIQNHYGFFSPNIDTEKCIECELCIRACPILSPSSTVHHTTQAYALYSRDIENIKKSTSGGVFYDLSRYVIEQKGIVFGVISENGAFFHTCTETIEGLEGMRGSKYVQSEMGDNLRKVKKILSQGRLVLFTGTPCQIAGLKSFLQKEYETLITCELVCHGVPSLRIFDRCMDLTNIVKENREIVSFRDTAIWNYMTTVKGLTGIKKRIFWKNDIYMKLFARKYIYKEICYSCPFATLPRVADVTIGDYWGIKDSPDFHYNRRGTSVLLVNSSKGERFFSTLSERFIYIPKTIDEAAKHNQNIKYPTQKPIGREALLKDLFLVEKKQELIKKYRLHLTLRNILGYIYRKIKFLYVR